MKKQGTKTYKVGVTTAMFIDAVSECNKVNNIISDAVISHYGEEQGGVMLSALEDSYIMPLIGELSNMMQDCITSKLCSIRETNGEVEI